MTAFQRATTIANLMPAADRSPSTAMGLPAKGFSDSQNPIMREGSSATVNSREFQWVGVTGESNSTTSSVR